MRFVLHVALRQNKLLCTNGTLHLDFLHLSFPLVQGFLRHVAPELVDFRILASMDVDRFFSLALILSSDFLGHDILELVNVADCF